MMTCYTGKVRLSCFLPALGPWVVPLVVGCGDATSREAPPQIDAGDDRRVVVGEPVELTARSSSQGPASEFLWTLNARPEASVAVLESVDGLQTRFTPDVAGDYIVSVVAVAQGARSAAEAVVVSARALNLPPRLAPRCGPGTDCRVAHGREAVLDGRNTSDPEGDVLTVQWSQLTDPLECVQCPDLDPCDPSASPAILTDADQTLARFQAPDEEDTALVFLLEARDPTNVASACLRYETFNTEPNARAAASTAIINPAEIGEGASFTLSATASFDADEDPLVFSWRQIDGSPLAFDDARLGPFIVVVAPEITLSPTVVPAADLVFEVTVSDGIDQSRTQITVAVQNL
ncbi:MAG: hypothetical protein AAFQ65_05370 [Myxococcota bacterium]